MKRIETGIYRKPDGRLFVRTTATDPYTGEIVYKTKTMEPGKTLRDARTTRENLKARVSGARAHTGPKVRTVDDYAVWWLSSKGKTLKPSARDSYANALMHLTDVIGGVGIRDVVRADLQQAITAWEQLIKTDGTSYATDTLRGWWRVTCVMMRDAHADGLLDTDPTLRVRLPKTKVSNVQERETLSAEQLGEFVAAVREVAPRRYAEVVTLAYTGMRAGELYALTWEDIDWPGKRIHIRRAVSRRQLTDTTKTGAEREAPMVDLVANALQEHHASLVKRSRLEELVFPASKPRRAGEEKKPRAADSLRSPFDKARERVNKTAKKEKRPGIDIVVRAQVLRRTFNTLMLMAGVDKIVTRSMLGHSEASGDQMTERYAGVRIEDKNAAVLRVISGGEG